MQPGLKKKMSKHQELNKYKAHVHISRQLVIYGGKVCGIFCKGRTHPVAHNVNEANNLHVLNAKP